ncbi:MULTISPECIES: COG2426 family protein [Galbibacter]|uniref:Small multi-drug export protein n=1 Tax=Galbibacter pacificus TaxID=2996052 RepID=A0ABT6FUS2_9FLAO|nr:small multi-drug export protein [Galbibacter pacificus]MDG3583512.1 small multi-drug export protein [Galbibacter pacificus]MDG3587012.1 small multi-drug export protein [Galbibacter pacificus]
MIAEILVAMLWSVSPFGEAKVGIPYAIFNNVNIYLSFLVCFAANVLVYPIMMFFLDYMNAHLLKWNFYKKSAIKVARRIKKGAGTNVGKFGFYGILIFVMLPIPGTGVYAGSIAAYLFRMPYQQAFLANTIGIFLSCAMVWGMTMATYHGIN